MKRFSACACVALLLLAGCVRWPGVDRPDAIAREREPQTNSVAP